MIAGGILNGRNNSFTFKFSLDTEKFSKHSRMLHKRMLYASMVQTGGKVFAVGGAQEGECEYYNIDEGQWKSIRSYNSILPDNDL